jgi:hypothetical protein
VKQIFGVLAVLSLLACTAVPFAYFRGRVTVEEYKTFLFLASIAWFVFATLWSTNHSGAPGDRL